METGLVADLAIVKAWGGDPYGNLIYLGFGRSFNPVVATCGKVTVAEVEEFLAPDSFDPDMIHTSGIFVQHLVQSTRNEKRIEQRTIRKEAARA